MLLVLWSSLALAQDIVPLPDPNVVIQAMQSGYWPVIVWGIILGGIYTIKLLPDKFNVWGKIPARYRPLVVVGLGALSAVGQAKIAKHPWIPALMQNLFASLAAIGADQTQSKLRKPKDGGSP